ncbi:MAG: DNA cytosine methyltransferase [Propionibacteriaceae bacterium]|nr:DNA cytosine methyltransferase [Propionibacteriaceae bacterium]
MCFSCPRARRIIRVGSLTALDLFAGCGGLSLGLTWSGWNVLAAVERSPMASETYFRNFCCDAEEQWTKHTDRTAREALASGLLVDDVAVLPTVLCESPEIRSTTGARSPE